MRKVIGYVVGGFTNVVLRVFHLAKTIVGKVLGLILKPFSKIRRILRPVTLPVGSVLFKT